MHGQYLVEVLDVCHDVVVKLHLLAIDLINELIHLSRDLSHFNNKKTVSGKDVGSFPLECRPVGEW